jgi:integrase
MIETTKRTTRKRKSGRRTFGTVWQLPSGRYRATYIAPDGERRAGESTFRTIADADAWLSTVSADIVRGTWRPPEPSRETVGAYAKRWLALGVGRSGDPLSPTTKELYELLWSRWIEPTFGEVALGDVSVETVRIWLGEARAEHPSSTQPAKAYRLLRVILNVAVDDEKIFANPCRIRGAGKESAPERPVAMPEQVLAIAEAIEGQYRALVILGAWCSLRFGELAGLRRSRVDLLHRKIHVVEQLVELAGGKTVFKSPKTDSGRTVDVPAELVPILEDHLAHYVGADADALVFSSREGHPLRRTKFRPRWADACRSVGVSGLHFHDLRGSGATWAAVAGATLPELMHRLGHRTHTAALRYQHATAERHREVADRLGALLNVRAEEEPAADVVAISKVAE